MIHKNYLLECCVGTCYNSVYMRVTAGTVHKLLELYSQQLFCSQSYIQVCNIVVQSSFCYQNCYIKCIRDFFEAKMLNLQEEVEIITQTEANEGERYFQQAKELEISK